MKRKGWLSTNPNQHDLLANCSWGCVLKNTKILSWKPKAVAHAEMMTQPCSTTKCPWRQTQAQNQFLKLNNLTSRRHHVWHVVNQVKNRCGSSTKPPNCDDQTLVLKAITSVRNNSNTLPWSVAFCIWHDTGLVWSIEENPQFWVPATQIKPAAEVPKHQQHWHHSMLQSHPLNCLQKNVWTGNNHWSKQKMLIRTSLNRTLPRSAKAGLLTKKISTPSKKKDTMRTPKRLHKQRMIQTIKRRNAELFASPMDDQKCQS